MFILGYDEKVDQAKQGCQDQGEDHGTGEVLIRELVVLHDTRERERDRERERERETVRLFQGQRYEVTYQHTTPLLAH